MTTFKVLVSDKLSEAGLDVFREASDVELVFKTGMSPEELSAEIADAHALVIRSATTVTPEVFAAAKELRAVGRAGIGVDNVNLGAASRRGVVVMNTPFGNAVTTAEHALSLLLSLARQIPQATASMKAAKWEKKKFKGIELWNKTLGIVGLGNIGKLVAERALGLRMKVVASDPFLTPAAAADLGVELVSFQELLEKSDFITMHTPLTKGTKHIFGAEAFKRMKKGALLVNAARGGIVDEAALAEALENGQIAGAALDVFEVEPPAADHPLLGRSDVILTPHLGASTGEAQERVGVQIAHQIIDYLRTGNVKNGVNVPTLSSEARKVLESQEHVADKLGGLLAQLAGKPRSIRVVASGPLCDVAEPLTHQVAAGFLSHGAEDPVNALAAPHEAKERGIELEAATESQSNRPTIRVTVTDEDGIHTATGRVGADGVLRLVGLEGYPIDATLGGHALVIRNHDKPGVIGAVGSVLGEAGVNVARMQVGLDEETKVALSFWNVDSAVEAKVLEKLGEHDNIDAITYVTV